MITVVQGQKYIGIILEKSRCNESDKRIVDEMM